MKWGLSVKGEGRGNISRQMLLRSSKVICQQALNRICQPGWNTSQNTCPLYIVCQVLKLLLIIIYKMQPPSSFISYLLFYVFLFHECAQGDCLVLCTKKNLRHHYPRHLKIYFKRNLRLPFFWSGTIKSRTPQAQTKPSASIKVSIPSTSILKFSMIAVVAVV